MLAKNNPIVITEFDHKRLHGLLTVMRERSLLDGSNLEMLEEELERADIVAPSHVPANVITMNSEVLLRDLDTDEQLEVRLVFPGAAQASAAKISVLAPIGLALLGCREHEELSWSTKSRVRRMRVERIVYQPEAAGNFTL